jgi:hypothetical protein
MPEKTERKARETEEWGAWFERLIRGDISRDSREKAEEQVARKGTRAWQQQ